MGIAKKLEEVKSTCFALKKYDKSSFNRGVDDASISKWENKNALTIPDELKILLSISNGFQVLGRSARVFILDDVRYRYSCVPDEYVVFGELVGDGEMLCFHEKQKNSCNIQWCNQRLLCFRFA